MRLLIAALAASGDPAAPAVLQAWGDKGLGLRKADGAYLLISPDAAGFVLQDLTGAGVGTVAKSEITQLKPNADVRAMIATALVQFTLSDPDPAKRQAALESIAKDPKPEALPPYALRSKARWIQF